MEGVNIIDQNRRKQGITLRRLRDASIKQGKRLAKNKRISGKDVYLITYLKKRCLFKILSNQNV